MKTVFTRYSYSLTSFFGLSVSFASLLLLHAHTKQFPVMHSTKSFSKYPIIIDIDKKQLYCIITIRGIHVHHTNSMHIMAPLVIPNAEKRNIPLVTFGIQIFFRIEAYGKIVDKEDFIIP